jgi:hypothetical protein
MWKWIVATLCLVLVVVGALVALCFMRGQRELTTQSIATIASLSDKYAIEIMTADVPDGGYFGQIHAADGRPRLINRYVAILNSEWSRYPPDLVKRAGIRRIILCEGLRLGDQLRAAIPDFESGDLYLDVARGSAAPGYQREVIHHELFHVIDLRDDGLLYADPAWSALNAPGFQYGNGGVSAQGDAWSAVLNPNLAGFLNTYSMTGVEEDKAEIYANLIVNRKFVEAVAVRDAVVRAKVERMKGLMRGFSSEVGEGFWKAGEELAR